MDAGGRAMQEQLPRHEGHEVFYLNPKRCMDILYRSVVLNELEKFA
jgi:hypothetical protein